MHDPSLWLIFFLLTAAGIGKVALTRRIRRQARRGQMIFKAPVTIIRMGHRWVEGESYTAEVILGFGPLQGEAEEFVEVVLTFDWDEGGQHFSFADYQFGVLLLTVWRHGIGKKWTGAQISAFRHLVEGDVARSILQHRRSMDSLADHGVAG